MKILFLFLIFIFVVSANFQENLEKSLKEIIIRKTRSEGLDHAFLGSERIVEKNDFYHIPFEYLPVHPDIREHIQSICFGRRCSSRNEDFDPQHLIDTAHLRGTVHGEDYAVHLINHES